MNTSTPIYDVAVVGGGIVGLATAWQFQQKYPDRSLILLEKESEVAFHQTGRNSGVLHTGIYYKPGSLRAINCRAGKLAMERFCEEHGVPFDRCGKVIVAVDENELERLEGIYQRGQQNGVQCEIISAERLHEIEPHVAGVRAIHVPEAGIVDYKAVCMKLADGLMNGGAKLQFNARVSAIRDTSDGMIVESSSGTVQAKQLITCPGLYSDRVARLSGHHPRTKIVPFRGEYYELLPHAESLVNGLIYPTPDPRFPFLGVHFTRMIQGGVECGPNAVLAFAREGYRIRDVNLRDLCEVLTYPGFLKLAAKYWQTGLGEMWRSVSKRAFVKTLQRLVPEITPNDLHVAPAGVRAQALQRDGQLVDDFVIEQSDRVINVLNAPSPAATASLTIGKEIVNRLDSRF
ncbi:MAG: L-2-hydroxyglutarate oxidase [Planctomycetaceae bacterium]|jgi:(S)-2-hydroxyglutarate dehydrogenase|nr:L-2-hydroxyglutarate oxidase [Planctomycetaceae bacterium]